MHLTVIAKAPVAGRVKTRLCPPCTPEQAAAIAAAALADTFDAIAAIDGDVGRRTLLLDGELQSWMPPEFAVVAQRGEGLGERLRNGFGDLGPGVITGMETPHVAHLLGDAIAAVRHGSDVLGLADDGGYWMIGLCAATVGHVDAVFAGVPMSTTRAGAAQLDRLQRLGGAVLMLPTARDLDTFDDLCAIAASDRVGRLPAMARDVVSGEHLAHPASSPLTSPRTFAGPSGTARG